MSLPISAFLWVTAPEFIPLLLGPKWGAVVTPFRLFSISLLFRMSSRISETCVSAAGRVYSQAVFTAAYAAMVMEGELAQALIAGKRLDELSREKSLDRAWAAVSDVVGIQRP